MFSDWLCRTKSPAADNNDRDQVEAIIPNTFVNYRPTELDRCLNVDFSSGFTSSFFLLPFFNSFFSFLFFSLFCFVFLFFSFFLSFFLFFFFVGGGGGGGGGSSNKCINLKGKLERGREDGWEVKHKCN